MGDAVMLHSAAVGLSWKTAQQSLRDRAYISVDEEDALVHRLAVEADIRQVVVLSTCNRIELYLIAADPHEAVDRAWKTWSDFRHLEDESSHFYRYFHEDAVRHLFEVASSVDSIVQGETQISSQIRAARARAQKRGGMDSFLQRLFQDALACSKRVRSSTAMGEGNVSVASAAVQLVAGRLNLPDCRVAVVGGGTMAEASWRNFQAQGVRRFVYVNRRPERVTEWAKEVPGPVHGLDCLEEIVRDCDVVLTAVSSPVRLIDSSMIPADGRRRFLLDISAPRVIGSDCAGADTEVVGIDDLREVVKHNRQLRAAEAETAEALIADEVERFARWVRARAVLPELRQWREETRRMAHQLAVRHSRHLEQLAGTDRFETELEGLALLLADKFLHHSTVSVNELAAGGDELRARALLNFLRKDEQ